MDLVKRMLVDEALPLPGLDALACCYIYLQVWPTLPRLLVSAQVKSLNYRFAPTVTCPRIQLGDFQACGYGGKEHPMV